MSRPGASGTDSFRRWWSRWPAVVGAAVVVVARPLLPYALAFAAGAMIFVVVEEVVPEAQRGGNTDLATIGTMTGFALMMVLDVALA